MQFILVLVSGQSHFSGYYSLLLLTYLELLTIQ